MRSVVAVLALVALPAAAQERVDERRPAAADGAVLVETGGGSVRVSGWDRSEVAVTGTLGAGAERVAVQAEGRETRVEVEPAGPSHLAQADLDVKVPAGSRVSVKAFQARVEVRDVKGVVRVETVNGAIVVAGAAEQVDAESVNGGVAVSGRSARIHVESVNGSVTVTDPGADVQAGTVNGRLVVDGSRGLERARLESVNGPLVFQGELAPRGTLEVNTVSGRVDLALSPGAADVNVSTFNGRIVNELGPPSTRAGEHERGEELAFSIGGGGGARISVRTLNGAVKITGPRTEAARQPRKD